MNLIGWLEFAGKFLGLVLVLVLLGTLANLCLLGWMEMARRCARTLRWHSGR